MAPHEGHRIEARIGMVAGVEADLQDALVDLVQQTLQFRLEVDEAGGVGMDADGQAILLGPQLCDRCDTVAKGRPFGRVHLFGGVGAARGRRAAGRDAVDQHQMLRAMRRQRLAGADGGIPDLIPFGGIVKRAEDHAADQLQPVGRPEPRPEPRGLRA